MKRFYIGMFAAVALLAAAPLVSPPVAYAQSGTVQLECRPGECSPAFRTLEARPSEFRLINAPATPAAHSIDLRPLISELVFPLVAGIGLWLATWISTRVAGWLKLSRDDIVRKYLEKALMLALDYGKSRLDQGTPLTVSVKSKIVADAATYAVEHVPGALKHFGVDADGLKRMLAARLESTTAAETPKAS